MNQAQTSSVNAQLTGSLANNGTGAGGPGDFGLDDDILEDDQNQKSSSSSYSAASDEYCDPKERGASLESSRSQPRLVSSPPDGKKESGLDGRGSSRKKLRKGRVSSSPGPRKLPGQPTGSNGASLPPSAAQLQASQVGLRLPPLVKCDTEPPRVPANLAHAMNSGQQAELASHLLQELQTMQGKLQGLEEKAAAGAAEAQQTVRAHPKPRIDVNMLSTPQTSMNPPHAPTAPQ